MGEGEKINHPPLFDRVQSPLDGFISQKAQLANIRLHDIKGKSPLSLFRNGIESLEKFRRRIINPKFRIIILTQDYFDTDNVVWICRVVPSTIPPVREDKKRFR